MTLILHLLTGLAIVSTGAVYGTDVFCAIVQRPALTHVDDATLTTVMGHVHQYGDKRLPIPGAISTSAAVLAGILAVFTNRPAAAVFAGIAAAALAAWLIIYARVSAPVNKQLKAAVDNGRVPADVRGSQHTWDSVITTRAVLQGLALAALCVALAV